MGEMIMKMKERYEPSGYPYHHPTSIQLAFADLVGNRDRGWGGISRHNRLTLGVWDMEQRVALDVHDCVNSARFQNCHGGTKKIRLFCQGELKTGS